MSATANQKPSDEAQREAGLRCTDLLACPFCGAAPTVYEMRYVNTGRLYGYRLKCGGCGLEIKEQPVCWPAGKENEEMLDARTSLVTRWNTRHANGLHERPGATTKKDTNAK